MRNGTGMIALPQAKPTATRTCAGDQEVPRVHILAGHNEPEAVALVQAR